MQLELKLFCDDLKPECVSTHLSSINADCFKLEVVEYLRMAGKATYYNRSGGYNVVYYKTPKQEIPVDKSLAVS